MIRCDPLNVEGFMSGWNGKDLVDSYTDDAGYSDSAAKARTLKYINEIQRDICSSNNWANLKFKLKKLIKEGTRQFDVSPQIPEAPVLRVMPDGELASGVEYSVKVTFVAFDESEQEYSSIESEPSEASKVITPTDGNIKIQVLNISTYDGDCEVSPLVFHRRIYLKHGNGTYKLAGTIKENDSNSFNISALPSSIIEPPERSMVENLSAEDLGIQIGSVTLTEEKLDNIQKYDPGMTSVGAPRYYARISETKVLIYPRPSQDTTVSYWVKRRPSTVFADKERPVQMSQSLENVLEVGVSSKWLRHKQDSDWTTMHNLYKELKSEAKAEKVKKGGQALTVKVVC